MAGCDGYQPATRPSYKWHSKQLQRYNRKNRNRKKTATRQQAIRIYKSGKPSDCTYYYRKRLPRARYPLHRLERGLEGARDVRARVAPVRGGDGQGGARQVLGAQGHRAADGADAGGVAF